MQNTILVVDDEKNVREVIKAALVKENYRIYEAALGRRLNEIIREHPIDLVLLDLHLPDGNGLSFLENIRTYANIPIIILSGRCSDSDRIKGLDSGADDYISKPFVPGELRARIKAALRRYHNTYPSIKSHTIKQRIKFDRWILDPARCQIYSEQEDEARLTIQEFQLLEALVNSSRKVLNRKELIHIIADAQRSPCARAIDVHITRLRKKIGDDATAPRIIRTVRGAGYMLDCDTEFLKEELL